MTYTNTTNRRLDLMDAAHECGVSILFASKQADQLLVAIHLLNPDLDKLEDALETAAAKGFERIVIHSNATWPR